MLAFCRCFLGQNFRFRASEDRLNDVKGEVRLPDRKKRASQCWLGYKAAGSDMIGRQKRHVY
jgi:hypothetical protein